MRSEHDGSGASGAIDPLAEVGRLLPSGVTNVAGGGPSHGREHAHLDAHLAELARQAHHLRLHTTGHRQAVRTDHGHPQQPIAALRLAFLNSRFGHGLERYPGCTVLRMTATPAMPALSVIGTPTKRTMILELAAEAERRGFAGLASSIPGVHGNLAMCGSLAHVTNTIPFWTSIQPIYHCHPVEVAITAAHLHEVSGGRFRLGLGVSHAPAMDRLGISTGKPLHDMGDYRRTGPSIDAHRW